MEMENDVSKMKVADLKRELKNRGLSTIGNKTELCERLQANLDGVEGDELLDDTVLTDEEEANILADDENELLHSPKALKINVGEPKDEDELLLSPTPTPAPAKKVVLKRKNSFKDIESNITSKENTQPAVIEPKVLKMSERNPIKIAEESGGSSGGDEVVKPTAKLSELSEKERKEMRAKKFGQATTIPAATVATPAAGGDNMDDEQMEKLKKRAERFGIVSPAIAKLDEKEKLLKRQQRFGGGDATANNTSGGNDVWAEKARLRLERFKTATAGEAAK